MAKKRCNGEGSIRKRIDGMWEGRVVAGFDKETGKPIRKSVYGKTQKEVKKKVHDLLIEIAEEGYIAPSKTTVKGWINRWLRDYTRHLKPYTVKTYTSQANKHIFPYIGDVSVTELTPAMIIDLYNRLIDEEELSVRTVKIIHSVLRSSYEALIDIGEVKKNPCAPCAKRLPKAEKKKLQTLADDDLVRFMKAVEGDEFENILLITLFTGLRQGEVLGLRWSNVNFEEGSICIDKQLYIPPKGGQYYLQEVKNRKTRTLYPAKYVFDLLKKERIRQNENRLKAGENWRGDEIPDLVFTNCNGRRITHRTVYDRYKYFVKQIGLPELRFHDMRHSYAVSALRAGDDIKTVQENLGHATAAFTLDEYAFATSKMKKESANRMDEYVTKIRIKT